MTNSTPTGQQTRAREPSRNAPCPCGSGKKYKQCCGARSWSHGSQPGGSQPDPRAYFQRGVQLLRSGQTAAAMPVLLQAMQLDPNHFEAHHALGVALMRSGRLPQASAILSRAVTLNSGSAAAWRDLGASYDRQNLHPQAMEGYRKSLDLQPNVPELLYRLGELYAMYSRTEEAADFFDQVADLDPESTRARLLRSDARLLRGDTSGAEEWAQKAVAHEPGSDAAHGTLAGLLYANGRFEEAAESFEAALRLNPKAARCWHGLTQSRSFSKNDKGILDRMLDLLGRGDLSEAERMTMHFAVGKVYDDCGEYARAMEQFDAANILRARELTFDRAGFQALVERTIQRFTRGFIESNTALGSLDERPLFIVGMYRSGTTLVEQIVSSHPEIEAGGELTVWAPNDIDVDPATGGFAPARVRAAIDKYLVALEKIGPGAARVTDKLPFNFLRLGAIHALFPRARIIHCQRDPIDTCLSIYSNLFKTRVPFAATRGDLAFVYRQYLRIVAHWREVLPPDILLDVEYERLIADTATQTRRLIAFTGLAWNDDCLRPEQNLRPIDTASARQARQPLYASSVERWRHYEPWLGELRDLHA